MKSVICHLVGESPYSQSKVISIEDVPRLNSGKETPDAYEKRCWRHRMHVTKDGHVEIPGSAFAVCIKSSAKRLKLQVPGKGRSEYTKYFEAGIMCPEPIVLPVKAAEVPCDHLHVPSDGRRGGTRRVWKYFPRIDQWEGKLVVWIFDEIITADVFKTVLTAAGQLVGIGRFRPESSGVYGIFSVKSIEWSKEEETIAALGSAAAE